MWKNMKKILYLKDLDIILATREFARFVVDSAINKECNIISLSEVQITSRSFLDELYILAQKEHLNIIDIPQHLAPLFEIIKKSHKDQVLYAPNIKVRISDKTFA